MSEQSPLENTPHLSQNQANTSFNLARRLGAATKSELVGTLAGYAGLFLHAFSLRLEVFSHEKMGERHASPLFLVLFGLEIGLVMAALDIEAQFFALMIGAAAMAAIFNSPIFLFEGVATALIILQWYLARRARKNGEDRHSFSTGIPLIARINPENKFFYSSTFRTWVQPAVFFFIGILLTGAGGLGLLIMLYSMAMWVRNLMLDIANEAIVLDTVDIEIVAKHHQAALAGAKPQDAGGLDFRGLTSPKLSSQLPEIRKAFAKQEVQASAPAIAKSPAVPPQPATVNTNADAKNWLASAFLAKPNQDQQTKEQLLLSLKELEQKADLEMRETGRVSLKTAGQLGKARKKLKQLEDDKKYS